MIRGLQSFRGICFSLVFALLPLIMEAKTCCNESYTHSLFEPTCDLCGCSTSAGSFGFGSLKNSNFVGLRYIYQNYESKDGIFENSPISKEQFNTYQIWGRVPITEEIYVSSIMPYQDLYRTFEDRVEHINGIGDMNVIGWYQFTFYKKQEAGEINFSMDRVPSGHRIQIGIGAKLPTGEFEEALTDRVNPGFQLGTGSLDGIFSLNHGYSGSKIGVNTTADCISTEYLSGPGKIFCAEL